MERHESHPAEVLKRLAESDLPAEVKEALRKMNTFEYQDENGVDLTLIWENLRLSPEERLERNLRHRRCLLEARNHVRTLPSR